MSKIFLNSKMALAFIFVWFCGPLFVFLLNTSCSNSPIVGQGVKLENANQNNSKSMLIIDRPQILSTAFYGTQFVWVLLKEKNRIIYTDNGGEGWQELLSDIPQRASKIYFIDSRNGWVVADVPDIGLDVWRTTNGGIEWKKIAQLKTEPMQSSFTNVEALHFVDSQNGWILETTSIWTTHDGGESWEDVSPPSIENLDEEPVKAAFNNHKAWFIGSKGSVYFTESAGKSWRKQIVVKGLSISDIFFLTDEIGWAVNEDGTLFLTQNGGKTWQQRGFKYSNDIEEIKSIFFLNGKDGWIVGRKSAQNNGKCENNDTSQLCTIVQSTTDGGQSWQKVNIESTGSFSSSIMFTDKECGWFISSNNLYRTANTGLTWHKILLQ